MALTLAVYKGQLYLKIELIKYFGGLYLGNEGKNTNQE